MIWVISTRHRRKIQGQGTLQSKFGDPQVQGLRAIRGQTGFKS